MLYQFLLVNIAAHPKWLEGHGLFADPNHSMKECLEALNPALVIQQEASAKEVLRFAWTSLEQRYWTAHG